MFRIILTTKKRRVVSDFTERFTC